MATNTHPIGPGTVNRTANLPRELDERLGKAVYATGAKSRGEIIRTALQRYLADVAKGAALLLVWGGAAAVCSNGATGMQDQMRRGGSQRSAIRVVSRGNRIRRREDAIFEQEAAA